MIKQVVQSFSQGFKRRKVQGLGAAFSGLGFLWLLTEIIMAFSPTMKAGFEDHASGYFILAGTTAVAFFMRTIYEPRLVKFDLPMTNSQITIKYGDLFKEPDDMLIAVNEYVDSQLGDPVSPASVHGGFIRTFFNSDEARFRTEVDAALSHATGTQVQRAIMPATKFPVGTTARLRIGHRVAYLFVLTETDDQHKASSTVPYLWDAMQAVLAQVRTHGNGRALALPLIGNGRSGLDLPPQHLLRLLILALVEFAKKSGLPQSVTIVAPDACFEHLDLREIVRDWGKK
ncbi:MAG: macro domain-containing protein [Pseudomonadota bacterium]